MKRNQRILGRILAKELKPEELGLISGSDTIVVVAARSADGLAASGGDDPTGPPTSTLLATLPDYHEDQ